VAQLAEVTGSGKAIGAPSGVDKGVISLSSERTCLPPVDAVLPRYPHRGLDLQRGME
jgi:hypothetical protein